MNYKDCKHVKTKKRNNRLRIIEVCHVCGAFRIHDPKTQKITAWAK